MVKQDTRLIRVNKQTKDILNRLRKHPKDSYDVVINTLISKCYETDPIPTSATTPEKPIVTTPAIQPTPTLTSPPSPEIPSQDKKPDPLPIKKVGVIGERNDLY